MTQNSTGAGLPAIFADIAHRGGAGALPPNLADAAEGYAFQSNWSDGLKAASAQQQEYQAAALRDSQLLAAAQVQGMATEAADTASVATATKGVATAQATQAHTRTSMAADQKQAKAQFASSKADHASASAAQTQEKVSADAYQIGEIAAMAAEIPVAIAAFSSSLGWGRQCMILFGTMTAIFGVSFCNGWNTPVEGADFGPAIDDYTSVANDLMTKALAVAKHWDGEGADAYNNAVNALLKQIPQMAAADKVMQTITQSNASANEATRKMIDTILGACTALLVVCLAMKMWAPEGEFMSMSTQISTSLMAAAATTQSMLGLAKVSDNLGKGSSDIPNLSLGLLGGSGGDSNPGGDFGGGNLPKNASGCKDYYNSVTAAANDLLASVGGFVIPTEITPQHDHDHTPVPDGPHPDRPHIDPSNFNIPSFDPSSIPSFNPSTMSQPNLSSPGGHGSGSGLPSSATDVPQDAASDATPDAGEVPAGAMVPSSGFGSGVAPASLAGGLPTTSIPTDPESTSKRPGGVPAGVPGAGAGRGTPGGAMGGGGMGAPPIGAKDKKDTRKSKPEQQEDEQLYVEDREWTEGFIGNQRRSID